MTIATEKDITGEIAKALREQTGENQKTFWGAVGLTQSGGSRYESGNKIPKQTRILIFIRYVAGLKLDASTPDGAAKIIRLANLQASEQVGDKEVIGAKLNTAMKSIRHAKTTLDTIGSEGGAA